MKTRLTKEEKEIVKGFENGEWVPNHGPRRCFSTPC
jgi:hypothetical protein